MKMIDYRRTRYCDPPINIINEKERLLDKIQSKSSSKNHYTLVQKSSGQYFHDFYTMYECKCSYCGVQLPIIPLDMFNIDHFEPKSDSDNNHLSNLVLSCSTCNKQKNDFNALEMTVNLHPDNGISDVFYRNDSYKICIDKKYKDNPIVQRFYEQLGLGHNLRKLDYLLITLSAFVNKLKDKGEKQEVITKLSDIENKLKEYRCHHKSLIKIDKLN